MQEKKLRIGILGAGRIGKVHAESLAFRLPRATPVVIADVRQESAREVAALCNIPQTTSRSEEVLADPEVDAVVICTPTNSHAELIIQAARAGKHIFCEKPIDLNLERIDSALREVADAGVKFQVGFNRRFDANYARARKAVRDGEVGTPQLLHIISRDPAPPPISYIRGSGGIFLDMTIHDFDMARFLMGDEVEEIFTGAGVMVDEEIGKAGDVDTALVMLRFTKGAIGVIDNSRKAVYGYDQRVEILGSGGAISTDNCYPNQAVLRTDKSVWRELPLHFVMDRYTESFIHEMRAFVDAVLDNTAVPVTGFDGRVPIVMGLAARKSFDEHRPVRLEEFS